MTSAPVYPARHSVLALLLAIAAPAFAEEALAATPRAGLPITATDISAYDCAAPTQATTVHMGQVIGGRYYEWIEAYGLVEGARKLTCVSVLVPQAQQLDAAGARAFLARSGAIGVPAAAAPLVPEPSASLPIEPADVKPEPIKRLKPMPPGGHARPPVPMPATQPNTSAAAPPAASSALPNAVAPSAAATDPRSQVSSSTSLTYPWNTVGYLSVTYPNGQSFRCSGTVVSPYVVLTAGHCIHNGSRGGYVTQVRFYPGQSASASGAAATPLGGASNWGNLQTTQTWTQISGPDSFDVIDYASDIAAIQFRTPFTYTSTFMPVAYESVDLTVTNAGYPADINGQTATAYAQYSASGDETSDSQGSLELYNLREFGIYSTGGNSGGPFWTTDSLGRAALVGSLSYGGSSPDVSGGPWYNYWNYPLLSNWIAWTPGTPSVSTLLSDGMHVGAVFSSAQGAGESYLRFFNNGSSAGSVSVSLENSVTGALLATWNSPSIAPGAELQFGLDVIESQANQGFARPPFYSLTIKPGIVGYFQHVLYHPADGTLTNLSTCDSGSINIPYLLLAVHSSLLNSGFPSTVVVYNTGATPTSVRLAIYDAGTGNQLGTYTTPSIPANGQVMVSVPTIEAALKITPGSGAYHYVVQATSNFSGYVQNLVNNRQAGVVSDMTTVCILPPA